MSDNRINKQIMVLVSAALLGACSAGPDYKRPEMQLPEQWAAPQESDKAAKAASERWWSLYADPVLDRLEDEALAHNADAQMAMARVLEVRAQLDVAESAQYPNVSASRARRATRPRSPVPSRVRRPRRASTPPRVPRWTRATSSICGASTAAVPRRRVPSCSVPRTIAMRCA